MKAHILAGKVVPTETVSDHGWFTKKEVLEKLPSSEHQSIDSIINR